METKVVYFDEVGIDYTDEVLRLVKQRAAELGIKNILVASSKGDSGVKAVKALKGFSIIVVTSAAGIPEPNVIKLSEENRRKIESAGGKVLMAGHALSGVSRAMSDKFHTLQIADIISHTLRIFGQGIKVACEITLMATDAGLVRSNEPVISLAGTKVGLDAAIVLMAVNSHRFFDLKVHEVICKPYL